MKIQKELAKISKDLEKMSRQIQKLTSSIPKEKGRAPKSQHAEASCTKQRQKIWNTNSAGYDQKIQNGY